jgi:nucleoside-diphosphate-sugar epimerase
MRLDRNGLIEMMNLRQLGDRNKKILITGSSGFVGSRLTAILLERGYKRIRCLLRPGGSKPILLQQESGKRNSVEFIHGNLTRMDDAVKAIDDTEIVFHCAAGKSGPIASMYLNTVVATRNLLDAAVKNHALRRFVHISSFAVYQTAKLKRNAIIDENTPIENNLKNRNDGYTYIKLKQEQLVRQYEKKYGLPVVILRPGVIYGPGGDEISRRVGLRLFGVFLNVGKNNPMPLSYIDNCVDAIIKAGTTPQIDGETINIHDSDLRTCNQFLSGFRENAYNFRYINVPYGLFWILSYFIESYSSYSKGQIPPILNRYKTASTWKRRRFSNKKLVRLLSWSPTIPTDDGLKHHFDYYHRFHSNSGI